MENIQESKNRFLEQLELLGLDIGSKLDQLGKEKQNYALFKRIQEQLESSMIEFCFSYVALSSEDKKEFQKRLLELFKDQEIVDNILQEMINLYYLKEEDLLELNETASQKEVALENLKTLATKIEKYLEEANLEEVEQEEKRLSDKFDHIVAIGSIIEGEDQGPIEDMDFLEEVLESVTLTNEDKRAILMDLIRHNLHVYQSPTPKMQEVVEQMVEEEKEDHFTITPECRNRIYELIGEPSTLERIVRIVNDDCAATIRIMGGSPEEQKQVTDSMELAREVMEDSMSESPNMTPEEALDSFFQKYDDLARKKRQALEHLLEQEEAREYTKEEVAAIFQEASDFQEERLSYIAALTHEDKERIYRFMNALYQNPDNRKAIYETRKFEGNEEVEADAAYEIQVMRSLLEVVPEEDQEMRMKVAHRLEEILNTVKEAVKVEEVTDTPVMEEGNLFFIMGDNDTTTLEEDLALESDKKGISAAYYGEIKNQLQAIQNRGERILSSTQPINPGFKAIKKEGVRCTKGVRTKVFFIPVGKKDAIIVGTSFITGKDTVREQELKIKKHINQLEELKERLKDPTYYQEEAMKAGVTTKKIMSLLSNEPTELESMFQEEPIQEDATQYQI